jgi:glycosyltransferase involved in cell wall biosynthesis
VPIDDVDALSTAIRRVLEEPGLREHLIEDGTRTYKARFTKDVFLRESRAFYDTVLGTSIAV